MKKIALTKRSPTDEGFETIEQNFDLIMGFLRARQGLETRQQAYESLMRTSLRASWHPFEVIKFYQRRYHPELRKYL